MRSCAVLCLLHLFVLSFGCPVSGRCDNERIRTFLTAKYVCSLRGIDCETEWPNADTVAKWKYLKHEKMQLWLYDVRSRKEHKTNCVVPIQHNIMPRVSPALNQCVWVDMTSSPYRWRSTDVETGITRDGDAVTGSSGFNGRWLKNGKYWLSIDTGSSGSVSVYSAQSLKLERSFVFPSKLHDYSISTAWGAGVVFEEAPISEHFRDWIYWDIVTDKSESWQTNGLLLDETNRQKRFLLELNMFTQVVMSPTAKKLLWAIQTNQTPDEPVVSVSSGHEHALATKSKTWICLYTSDISGKNARYLGYIPFDEDPFDKGAWAPVYWHPSGNAVTFSFRHKLYSMSISIEQK